jgi:hypothetical protein
MLARVLKRAEYKQAGAWRIVDPRVWNATQDSLANAGSVLPDQLCSDPPARSHARVQPGARGTLAGALS